MALGAGPTAPSTAFAGACEFKSRGTGLGALLALVAILLAGALVPSPALATSGPIAAYSFDEGTGTTVNDSAGNHDGTITGADWVGGKFGTALDFDSSARDLVTVADANELDLTSAFTLEAWVRPETSEYWAPVVTKEASPDVSYQLYAAGQTKEPEGYVTDRASSYYGVTAAEELPIRKWSHIALTSDGRDLRIYVDGDLIETASAVSAQVSAGDLLIGAASVNNEYFNGLIDEVRIYDRALIGPEIAIDRDTAIETPPSKEPIAAYSFDEGTGTRVNDSAGNHDGTITGATWVSGKFGGALDFDNTERDIVEIADSHDLDLSDAFTLEAWVRPETNGTGRSVIGKETSTFYSYSLLAGADTRVPTGILADKTSSYSEVNSAEELPVRDWSYLSLTSNGRELRLYVDGELIDTATALSAQTSDSPLQIGGNQIDEYFNGKIDEVRIYNRALSETKIEVDQVTAIETPPSRGPIAAYSFDEGTGTRVNDFVSNHDGTITGATWERRGKYGAALNFDGTDDVVEVADANDLDFGDSFTLEAWVKPDTTGAWRPAVTKETNDSIAYQLYAAGENREPEAYVGHGSSTFSTATAEEVLTEDSWSHLALSYDGSDLRLYVNGELEATEPSASAQDSTGPLMLGGTEVLDEYFDGILDEVRLYNRALTETEVEVDLATAIQTPPAEPVAVYSFDEGEGRTTADSVGGHSGTISGATWEIDGKYGTALRFDGVDDIVTIPDSADLDFSDGFTLETWVRPTRSQTNGLIITKETTTSFMSYQLYASGRTGEPEGYVAEDDSTTASVTARNDLSLNSWAHLTLTSDGRTLSLYVNGVLDATGSALPAQSSEGDLQIGGSSVFRHYFTGQIDELRLYAEPLNPTEIETDRDTSAGAALGDFSSSDLDAITEHIFRGSNLRKDCNTPCRALWSAEQGSRTRQLHLELLTLRGEEGVLARVGDITNAALLLGGSPATVAWRTYGAAPKLITIDVPARSAATTDCDARCEQWLTGVHRGAGMNNWVSDTAPSEGVVWYWHPFGSSSVFSARLIPDGRGPGCDNSPEIPFGMSHYRGTQSIWCYPGQEVEVGFLGASGLVTATAIQDYTDQPYDFTAGANSENPSFGELKNGVGAALASGRFPYLSQWYKFQLGYGCDPDMVVDCEIPDCREATLSACEEALEYAGFSDVRSSVADSSTADFYVEPNRVIGTSPSAGSRESSTTPITITVNPGVNDWEQFLLSRYRPQLVYDRSEAFRADSPALMTDWEYNTLSRENGSDVEYPNLSLRFLGSVYADREAATSADQLHSGGNPRGAYDDDIEAAYVADSLRTAYPAVYADKSYGRVYYDAVFDYTWVQYWFFYYFNGSPPGSGGFGAHEGDWEMVQFAFDGGSGRLKGVTSSLGPGPDPRYAVAAQHTGGSQCAWTDVVKDDGVPVMYPALDSHATYFGPYDSSNYPWFDDNVSGEGDAVRPSVVQVSGQEGWVQWPGRWGSTSRFWPGESDSPPGPSYHAAQWDDPTAWGVEFDGGGGCG